MMDTLPWPIAIAGAVVFTALYLYQVWKTRRW